MELLLLKTIAGEIVGRAGSLGTTVGEHLFDLLSKDLDPAAGAQQPPSEQKEK